MLTYIIAKFGFLFGIIIITIFLFLITRMFILSLRQTNSLGFIISLSITLIILIQGLFYISANLGIGFFGATALPFISYGKTIISNMCLMGLILSVFRNTKLVKEKPLKKENFKPFIEYQDGKIIINLK